MVFMKVRYKMEENLKKYGKYFLSIGIITYIILSVIFKNKSYIDNIDMAVTVTLILTSLYINYIWKYNFLDNHPKIYGEYRMTFVSTFNNSKKDIKIRIKQNLFSTRIYMKSDESTSKSINSNINFGVDYCELTYTYINEPDMTERHHSGIHYGTCKFKISKNRIISGEYYTDRNTAGNIINIMKI